LDPLQNLWREDPRPALSHAVLWAALVIGCLTAIVTAALL
jgi:hypothetical protein